MNGVSEKINLVDDYLFNNYDMKDFKWGVNPNSNKIAVLLDPRCHYRMRPTIVNILTHLGSEYNFLYIGTQTSTNYLKLVLPHVHFLSMTIDKDTINPEEYSDIMLGKELLDYLIDYEHLYIFQYDSFMTKSLPESIYEEQYTGALDIMYHSSITPYYCHFYNNGIGYRKLSFVRKCLENFSINTINEYRKKQNLIVCDNYVEDMYLSMCLSLMKYGDIRSLPLNESSLFFGQNKNPNQEFNSIGAIHGYDKTGLRFLDKTDIESILHN